VRSGQLDRRIIIEYQEVGEDPVFGTPLITWQPLVALPGSPRVAMPFWAQIQDALPSNSEAVKQGLVIARNQSRIRLRYRTDVTSAMRITDVGTGQVYQIVGGPAEIGRKEWTEVIVERYSS
jgi:head-tail adaptor